MTKKNYLVSVVIIILLIAIAFIKNPLFVVEKIVLTEEQKSSATTLRQHVEFLTSMNPPRNFANPESLEKAANYIFEQFQSYGLEPKRQIYQIDGKDFQNVIVNLGPVGGDPLVIGAHYDVCHDMPGADDNASGTAGLLELARLLSKEKDKLKRPLILVAYTLEEPPNFRSTNMGSYVHAESLNALKQPIKLMISLEMIGYFSDEEGSQHYPLPGFSLLYPTIGNFITIIGRPQDWTSVRETKALFAGATNLPLETANIPTIVKGVGSSDQYSYWRFGYPAIMITDTAYLRNLNYHKPEDTADRLDYQRMSEVVNGTFGIAIGI